MAASPKLRRRSERKTPRESKCAQITFVVHDREKRVDALIINESDHGCALLLMTDTLSPGMICSCLIQDVPHTKARVVWATQIDLGIWKTAIEFSITL